jgi:hypothetical protein
MTDTFQFLNALHTLTAETQEHIAFLDDLIAADTIPMVLRARFAEVRTSLAVQDVIIRRMGDQQIEIEEALERMADKLTPQG